MKGDQAKVTAHVRVAPDVAFEVFTAEIDRWWRRGPAYRNAGSRPGTIAFECRLGGRLLETWENTSGAQLREVGRVVTWEPPRRFVFEWRATNFAPDEVTEVEVSFDPTETGTNVTVIHRGFAKLRPDHPVRHGEAEAAFVRTMGLWWAGLLTSLREHVSQR